MAAEPFELECARDRAETASTQDVVMLLRAILGPQLVVSIAGARAPGCVAGWAQGRGRLSGEGEVRLRSALELALVVMDGEGIEAARRWIVRRDASLGGRSPLGVLAQDPPRLARRRLLEAARASLGQMGLAPGLVRSGPQEARP